MSPSQWGSVAAPAQKGQIAMVSRTQSQATDQPVTPVTAAPSVGREQPSSISLLDMARRKGADPVEMAVRGRIQYLTPEEVEQQVEQAKSAQEVMEEGQCQTCKERKYQDGSNDPGGVLQDSHQHSPGTGGLCRTGPRAGTCSTGAGQGSTGKPGNRFPVSDLSHGHLPGVRKSLYFRRHHSYQLPGRRRAAHHGIGESKYTSSLLRRCIN